MPASDDPTSEPQVPRIEWPEGRSFAFTVFDDPDGQTLEAGREVYALFADLGQPNNYSPC